jgi:regulator of sigma E protease
MSYALAFVGFSALIILHEFGHFAVAKTVGMRVEKFSLFFGPMLVKLRRGETVYGVGVLPIGGYVKITGMNPNEEVPEEVAPRAFYRQPVWKRIVVIAAGPLMNVLLAFLILAGIYLVRGEPVLATSRPPQVAQVQPGQPAAGALRTGDTIVAIDGVRARDTKPATLTALSSLISSHRCAGQQTPGCRAATPVRLEVERNGRLMTFAIYPRYDSSAGPARPRIGISYGAQTTFAPTNLVSSARLSVDEMWYVTKTTVSNVGRVLFSSQARKQVHGIVGIYTVTQQSFSFDVTQAFFVLALVSLSLAIINLFPFLPLDGGHIFWAVVEKVRGRAVSFSVMERASAVGIALFLFLFLIGFTNDINTLQNGGFHVR